MVRTKIVMTSIMSDFPFAGSTVIEWRTVHIEERMAELKKMVKEIPQIARR